MVSFAERKNRSVRATTWNQEGENKKQLLKAWVYDLENYGDRGETLSPKGWLLQVKDLGILIIRELEYPLFCLVPIRLSLDENLRAEEGGKSKAVFLLPMIPFASTPVTRVRTLPQCAVLTRQYKQTPFKTLGLLRFDFRNRFPGHKLYMQGILSTNEVLWWNFGSKLRAPDGDDVK